MWHGEGSWVTWVTEGSETTFSNTDRCWVKWESRNSALCCLIFWQATLKTRSSALQQLLFPPWQRASIWWWRIQYLKGLLVFHSKVSKFVVFCGFFFFLGGCVCKSVCKISKQSPWSLYYSVVSGLKAPAVSYFWLPCNPVHYAIESFLLCPARWPMSYYLSVLSLDIFLFSSPRCDSSCDIHPTLHHCHSYTHL